MQLFYNNLYSSNKMLRNEVLYKISLRHCLMTVFFWTIILNMLNLSDKFFHKFRESHRLKSIFIQNLMLDIL